MSTVAFIGLGAMGSRMAMNLLQAARGGAPGKLDSSAVFLQVAGEQPSG